MGSTVTKESALAAYDRALMEIVRRQATMIGGESVIVYSDGMLGTGPRATPTPNARRQHDPVVAPPLDHVAPPPTVAPPIAWGTP